jgi:hypothetical protein
MNFIEALQKCYNGFKIHREGWNSVTYLIFESGNILIVHLDSVRIYDPFFPDLLKNDWQVYEDKNKTYSFQEALTALSNGKTITRVRKSGIAVHIDRAHAIDELILFNYDDVHADDWRIIE